MKTEDKLKRVERCVYDEGGNMFEEPLIDIIVRSQGRWGYKILKAGYATALAREGDWRFGSAFCSGKYCSLCHLCLEIFKYIRFSSSVWSVTA